LHINYTVQASIHFNRNFTDSHSLHSTLPIATIVNLDLNTSTIHSTIMHFDHPLENVTANCSHQIQIMVMFKIIIVHSILEGLPKLENYHLILNSFI
jgi:hypothetical protein